jgi:hypothetical protein
MTIWSSLCRGGCPRRMASPGSTSARHVSRPSPGGALYAEGLALGVWPHLGASPACAACPLHGHADAEGPAVGVDAERGSLASGHVAPRPPDGVDTPRGKPSASGSPPLTATALRGQTPTATTPRVFFPVGIERGRRRLLLRRGRAGLRRGTWTPTRYAEGCRRRSLRRGPGVATPRAAGRRRRAPFL